MDKIIEILGKFDHFFDNLPPKGQLKLDRRFISISTITNQYYYEKKLELEYEHPLPPSPQMLKGQAGHDTVTALANPISREESVKVALEERELPQCIYEFSIGWRYKGVPINRSCFDCKELTESACPIFQLDTNEYSCGDGAVIASVFPFNKEAILGELDWALDYWLGNREAPSSKSQTKCWACDYCSVCGIALG